MSEILACSPVLSSLTAGFSVFAAISFFSFSILVVRRKPHKPKIVLAVLCIACALVAMVAFSVLLARYRSMHLEMTQQVPTDKESTLEREFHL